MKSIYLILILIIIFMIFMILLMYNKKESYNPYIPILDVYGGTQTNGKYWISSCTGEFPPDSKYIDYSQGFIHYKFNTKTGKYTKTSPNNIIQQSYCT